METTLIALTVGCGVGILWWLHNKTRYCMAEVIYQEGLPGEPPSELLSFDRLPCIGEDIVVRPPGGTLRAYRVTDVVWGIFKEDQSLKIQHRYRVLIAKRLKA